jgi:hypothetical protein
MRKLSFLIVLPLLAVMAQAPQNPHGDSLKIDCSDCHSTEGWTYNSERASFSHEITGFILEGQHNHTGCRACHTTLVFSEAKPGCVDCHADLHNNTVGHDCARCHNTKSWLVHNTTEIHQMSRFPLVGAHNKADCHQCHISPSLLEFQPLGIECIDCHRPDYEGATNPNHLQTGISTECNDCHRIDGFEWRASGITHDFFPLTKGHQVDNCAACHKTGIFEPLSPDCISCHQNDFNAAANPSHKQEGFTTRCLDCHTTDPGWEPARFDIHDAFYFPIFSGKHRGEWDKCSACHVEQSNYSAFSCLNCHEHRQAEMDKKHDDEAGYIYNSMSCLECHPNGTHND